MRRRLPADDTSSVVHVEEHCFFQPMETRFLLVHSKSEARDFSKEPQPANHTHTCSLTHYLLASLAHFFFHLTFELLLSFPKNEDLWRVPQSREHRCSVLLFRGHFFEVNARRTPRALAKRTASLKMKYEDKIRFTRKCPLRYMFTAKNSATASKCASFLRLNMMNC